MRKQLVYPIIIVSILLLTTLLIVLYAKGYRFSFQQGKPDLSKTGLLATESIPNGAEVYINDHLTTATNSPISLSPGEYTVKIQKAGYFPWEKKLKIEAEVVTKAEALLFPMTPKLESITTLGASNPAIDPAGTKIAYVVTSQPARKNGIYTFDMTANPVLSLQGASKQLGDDTLDFLSSSILSWSPAGDEVIASVSSKIRPITTVYSIKLTGSNQQPRDITAVLENTRLVWENEKIEKEQSLRSGIKAKVRKLIDDNFSILSWSPDENKILYVASMSAELPVMIQPRLPGINTLREVRNISKGQVYVYNIKEDMNTKVLDSIPEGCLPPSPDCHMPLTWFPDSEHLIHVHDKKIDIMEIDSSNRTTIFAGPFVDNYVYPWPNGSKIVILTNLGNPDIAPNLYTLSLR